MNAPTPRKALFGLLCFGAFLSLSAVSDEVPAAGAPLGTLYVYSTPPGLTVIIDRQEAGITPLEAKRVSAGTHTVSVGSACYETLGWTVDLEAGSSLFLDGRVAAKTSVLEILVRDGSGAGLTADLFVDGAWMGPAAGRQHLPVCARSVRVRRLGFEEARLELREGKEKPLLFEAVLEPLMHAKLSDQVELPGACFDMGSNEGREDERPVHRACLQPFSLDRHEVTVAEYRRCVEAGKCKRPRRREEQPYCNEGSPDRSDHPVNCLNWMDAAAYCAWRGADLPTEAQWEYAARGLKGRPFPWGDSPPDCRRAVLATREEGLGCGRGTTWPVCSKPEGNTPEGVCDLGGNVWEFVADWYDGQYYARAPEQDPVNKESFTNRVLRGGNWSSGPSSLRTTGRDWMFEAYSSHVAGFRCASARGTPPGPTQDVGKP